MSEENECESISEERKGNANMENDDYESFNSNDNEFGNVWTYRSIDEEQKAIIEKMEKLSEENAEMKEEKLEEKIGMNKKRIQMKKKVNILKLKTMRNFHMI